MSQLGNRRAYVFIAETAGLPKFLKCGWATRAEGPPEIARRIQALNASMAEVEPEWRDLWPLLAARAIKPGRDPGPLLDMTSEALADLIDRRARFDPPRYPEPVDATGYRLLTTVLRNGYDPLEVHVQISASYGESRLGENEVSLVPNSAGPIWKDAGRVRQLLLALIASMSPTWACASAFLRQEGRYTPWMTWTAPDADVPALYAKPAEPPAEVQTHLGGELRVWA
jgi:hypothetical protein